MIGLYKNYRTFYFLTSFIGGIAIISAYFMFLPQANMIWGFILCSVYIIAVAFAFQIKANKKYRALLDIMTQQCEAQKFIDECNGLIEKNKRMGKNIKAMLMINISSAYLNLGEHEKALETMQEINVDKLRDKLSKSNIEYLRALNMAVYYSQQNDAENAQKFINQAMEIIEKPPMTPQLKQVRMPIINRTSARIDTLTGNFEKAESFLKNDTETAKKMMQKVVSAYYLGVVYQKTDRQQQAKEIFMFAKDNGGDTLCAKLAKEALEAM